MINVDKLDLTTLYDGAAELVRMYKDALEQEKVNSSGALSNSASYDFDFDENDIVLYFIANSYWFYTEKGRRPTGGGGGQAWTNSLQDIQNWMENKMSRGWWIPKKNKPIPSTPKEIRSVAWVIRRKIHQKGFYGQNHTGLHILENVIQQAQANGLIDKMVNSVVQAFDSQINVAIEEI